MRIQLPVAQAARLQLQQMHDSWDEKDAAENGARPSPAPASQPTAFPARARSNPYRGSRQHLGLVQLAAAAAKTAAKVIPAARSISTAANLVAPAINVMTAGVDGVLSSYSSATARSVNETRPAARTSVGPNSSGVRERGNFMHRFSIPVAV